jgi:VCBS repeat-containing protein
LTILANGSYTFVPVANYNGAVPVVTYTMTDGSSGDTSTLALTVTPINDPPVAVNDAKTINEDAVTVITTASLLANDTDIDGSALTVTSVQGATHGTVSMSGGNITFTPDVNYSGPASFTYTISDGNGGTSTAAVNITIVAVADTPNLAVTNASGQVFNTGWETAANSDNTSQPNPGPTLEGWNLLYPTGTTGGVPTTPDTFGTNGVDRFETWTVGDQMSNQAGTLTTFAAATGDGTTFLELNNASSTTLPETLGIERTVVTQVGKVYDLSLDYAGRLGYSTAYNAIKVTVNGTVVGTYASTSSQTALDWQNLHFSFVGTGSDTIRIITDATNFDTNGRGAMIDDINLRFGQGAIQGNAIGGTQTDIALSQYVTASLNDTDGSEALTITFSGVPAGAVIITSSNPTGIAPTAGSVTISQADLASAHILLPASQVGTFSLGVVATATESSNGSSATKAGTLTLEIMSKGVTMADIVDTGVNTAPDAKNDTPTTALVEGAATTTLTGQAITGGLGNVADTDPNAGATLQVTDLVAGVGTIPPGTTALASPVTVTGRYGSLQIAANGSYTYTLDNANANTTALVTGQSGHDVFTYKIRDGQGGYDTAVIDITINGTSPATFTLMSTQSMSLATTSTSSGSPFTDANEVMSMAEDSIHSGSVLTGTTSSNGPVTVTTFQIAGDNTIYLAGHSATIAGVGSLLINTDGAYTFTPNANYNGSVPLVTYTMSDGVNSDTSTLSITVTPVVDGFTDKNEVAILDTGASQLQGSVLTGTSSVDGTVHVTTFMVAGDNTVFNAGQTATIAGVGTLQIAADGNYSFTAVKGYTGAVPIATYAVTDGSSTDTSTLTININHGPTAVHDTATATADTPVTIATTTLLINDSDPDGDPLTLFSVQNATHGTVAHVGSDVIFTPTTGYTGAASFNYTISDGHGGTSTTTVDLTINGVNHAPVAVADSVTGTANSPVVIATTTLLSNDTDPDSDPLSISSVLDATHGTVSLVGNNVVFTPTKDYVGDASFNYTISDGHGGTSSASVSITIAADLLKAGTPP